MSYKLFLPAPSLASVSASMPSPAPAPVSAPLPAPASAHAPVRDALNQLLLAHGRVRTLLGQFDRLRCTHEPEPEPDTEGRAALLDNLCDTLTLLTHMEEDFFYPAARTLLRDNPPAPTAFCDHTRLRRLIAQLDETPPRDPACDALVADMADCVVPCMNAAPDGLFLAVRLAGLDTQALGLDMAQWRRQQRVPNPTPTLRRPANQAGSTRLAASGWPRAPRHASAA
jgi:hypothetical protein